VILGGGSIANYVDASDLSNITLGDVSVGVDVTARSRKKGPSAVNPTKDMN